MCKETNFAVTIKGKDIKMRKGNLNYAIGIIRELRMDKYLFSV